MYNDYQQLLVKKEEKILVIKFNNPKKKNCVNQQAYKEIGRVLREVAKDDSVTVVVFTGVGDFYTAGNDLSAAGNISDMDAYIKEANVNFKNMVHSFIDCPKIIVSLVNGPCIGIGTTLAGLSDLLWCSETAYFTCPFVKLGIVPEAGSSYLFPFLVGRSKATEMILFGEKLTAEEAYQYKFASRIYKPSEVDTVIWPKLREYSELPPESLQISKRLMRTQEKENLIKAIDTECDELYKRFYSEEFMNAIIQFSMRKSKL
ncbi:enoyl-CoA delta isomerase 2-like [Musca vetustissima]|uniref:enoyl-CoA delta isomerase 2-like n=1 Tax=Musca vetustissima TaxID=27455 RepID=UPI002AB6E883|nr:enoyl-CoA delta isomerase 2-like [Musca vetustissima]